jgi:hypothetical protein
VQQGFYSQVFKPWILAESGGKISKQMGC